MWIMACNCSLFGVLRAIGLPIPGRQNLKIPWGRPAGGRRADRGHEPGRHHGAVAGFAPLCAQTSAQDLQHCRPDRTPASQRKAGRED